MRVILLTGDGCEHRYVARRLREAVSDLEVVIETREGLPASGIRSKLKRWMRRGPACVVDKALRELFRRMIRDGARRESDLRGVLGDRFDLERPVEQAHFVGSVNDPDAVDFVSEGSAGLVLVYGTGLVRKATLDAIGAPVLNLHTGLSPYYRGVACHFWPLIDGRPDRVGVTAHECVPELDAGRIFGTRVVPPVPGDTVHAVFARQVVAGAELYADIVRQSMSGLPEGTSQDLSLGREYRGVELGLLAEIRARAAVRRFG